MKSAYQSTKFTQEKRIRRGLWLKCETCKKEFYVFPSRIKLGNPRFCSIKCYDKLGKNNPFFGGKHKIETKEKWVNNPTRYKFKTGIENPNFIRFGQKSGFFGNTLGWWRNYLMQKIGKCEICNFSNKKILEIHHKNRNRKENNRENLILLCPNCHAEDHWKNMTGKYKWRNPVIFKNRFKNKQM